jgi:hypothetical protein
VLGVANSGRSTPSALDGAESVANRAGDEFLGNGPLEDATDAVDLGTDGAPAPASFDHPLPDGAKPLRSELRGRAATEEFPNRGGGVADEPILVVLRSLGDVMGFSPFQIGEQEFVHGDGSPLVRKSTSVCKPLGDQVAFGGADGGRSCLPDLDGQWPR